MEHHTAANQAHVVEPCQDNHYCPARAWLRPDQAKNATCQQIVPAQILNNTRLAGELCTNSSQCFNNAGGANCTAVGNNVGHCMTPVAEGTTCPDLAGAGRGHDYCPENMFCNSTKKCQPAIRQGGKCDQDTLCAFGLACIATDTAFTNFTCQPFGTVPSGSRFKEFLINEGDDYTGLYSVCESYNYNETDVHELRECRPGDKSELENESDLRKSGIDQMCNYKRYTGAGANTTHPVNATEPAECGFNRDTYAWCRKRKGDRWFLATHRRVKELDLSSFNCHPKSPMNLCHDAVTRIDKNLQLDFQQRLFEVSPFTGFARVANNDRCVAKTITAAFWQTRSPDSAFGLTLASVFTAVLTFTALTFVL